MPDYDYDPAFPCGNPGEHEDEATGVWRCGSCALRLAVQVAVVQLYEQHPADVLGAFSIDELRAISDATEPLRPRQVEDIYREALGLGPKVVPDA